MPECASRTKLSIPDLAYEKEETTMLMTTLAYNVVCGLLANAIFFLITKRIYEDKNGPPDRKSVV